jgi:hypothetical protein
MLARQARRETKKLTAAFVATNTTDSVACVAIAAVRAACQDGFNGSQRLPRSNDEGGRANLGWFA